MRRLGFLAVGLWVGLRALSGIWVRNRECPDRTNDRIRKTVPGRSLRLGFFLSLLLVAPSQANALQFCNDGAVFPVSFASFTSCTVKVGGPAGQDTFSNVQAALDLALEPNIVLDPTSSFCPSGCGGSEFYGRDGANDFEINPSSVIGSDTFEFQQIPGGTVFISLKQGTGFEVFKVPGAVPFTLTHDLGGGGTSHISTFMVAVPEPSTALLLGLGLVGLAARRRV